MTEALAKAQAALAELDRIGDDDGAIWALRVIGALIGWLGNNGEAQVQWRRAVERGEHADNRFVNDVLGWMVLGAWWGPTSVAEVRELADEALSDEVVQAARGLCARRAWSRCRGGGASGGGTGRGPGGEDADARLGDLISWGGLSAMEADMELGAGDPDRAYRALAAGAEVLVASSETGYLATVISFQSLAALELGRSDEALSLSRQALEIAVVDDIDPYARDRIVRGRVAAQQGDFGTAAELLQEAGRMLEPTDFAALHLDLALARAEVARLAGRPDDERAALADALAVAEAKGHTVACRAHPQRLEAVGGGGRGGA